MSHLDRPIRLTDIARASMFSPYHFHRIFQMLTGETIADFTRRLRLERALRMMAASVALGPHVSERRGGSMRSRAGRASRPSLTAIALSCGFASSSDFSRSFKQRFGVAPSRFDLAGWRRSHAQELDRLASGASTEIGPRPGSVNHKAPHLRLARSPDEDLARTDLEDSKRDSNNPDRFTVVLRSLPARSVAYIRVADPYKPDAVTDAAARLVAWAERYGLSGGQWLGYQWENPELVPIEQCRYHVGVAADRFTARGEIGRFKFPEMTVAQVEVRGGIDVELRALRWLYGTWLPRSGYAPDDHPCFESWIGRPFAHGTERFELHLQLPIIRL